MVGCTADHRARESTDRRTALLRSAHPDVAAELAAVAVALTDFDLELLESRTLDGRTQELIYRPSLH